ncbi:TorD/DmsD family molecular chaperone [Salipaludibacillus daqingensis]|uniref:TorD/DmsD family molecular chaperone n=1 Tax=Salipaludibacillus daqingensis TaxID=3041001 RepID=UPI0024763E03|nr:molecular chaperone TorD family protein [Salipaludibacillus daqingensis]
MRTMSYSVEEKTFLYVLFAQVMYGETDVLKHLFKTQNESFQQLDEDVLRLFELLSKTKEEELQIQYDNLFFIPGSYYVPPYLGKYACENDSEGEQQLLEKLAALYNSTGFITFAEKKYLRHDHLGHLLMFQHFLLLQRKEVVEEEVHVIGTILRDVLETILVPSFGKFEQKVSKSIKKGFYLDAVRLIHQFIDQERVEG